MFILLIACVAVVHGFVTAPSARSFASKSSFSSSSALRVSPSSRSNDSSTLGSTKPRNAGTTSPVTTIPSRHVRWHSDSEHAWALQTAVTTWKHPTTGQTVELHAMVHFGDESYYQAYNDPEFSQDRTVLYELLLDDSMLTAEGDYRRVTHPLGASLVDQNTAARYGWKCQVDVLEYQQPQWRHADWTRGEFQQALQEKQNKKRGDNLGRPAWQPVEASPSAAAEAATAFLIGPPTMSDKDSRRRLFSNLFLPGSSLTQVLRLTLWMTVPAPELSILLLDWSSTTSGRNVWQASWSPVLRFVLQAISSARLDAIQRLAFGQVLITGSRPSQQDSIAQSLLIQGRNQQALQVLDKTLAENDKNNVVLLYGSSHCPDLSQSLRQRGFVLQSTAWRTAWSVELDNDKTTSSAPLWIIPAALYLIASGTDWLASWQAVGSASDDPGQMALLAAAYGVRHVLLYLGISKVVLDWQRPGGVE
eukprot:scaffold362_cov176-Amphora_coffeaeformis.AAC.45